MNEPAAQGRPTDAPDQRHETSAAQGRQKVLLFIHGIGDDDPEREWADTLDAALRREGTEPLSARGYRIAAPSYLDLLEAPLVPKTDEPPMTYRKGSQEEYNRAAGSYWSALASIERTGIRGHINDSGFRGNIPPGMLIKAIMPRLFADAVNYCESADRRRAILWRLLEAIPKNADLAVVAHSLGTVIAADLVYYLPADCDLRMLVTFGSPLALEPLRKHLMRRRNRFPYERIGPWVNLTGTGDFVTAFRGLSPVFPEPLDVFINTGTDPREAHRSSRYLDDPAAARALDWLDRRFEARATGGDADRTPDLLLPEGLLSVVVGGQHALRLEQEQKPGDTRVRFGQGRLLLSDLLALRLSDAGEHHPILQRLTADNSGYLQDRFEPHQQVNLLLTAWSTNPVVPFEINLSDEIRRKGLEKLALDISVPGAWATIIADAERDARSVHHSSGRTWRRAAMVVVGAAAIAAAPMLIAVAAPAGLTGGAAIVAGLAALGPGGMLGGVGIVSLVGGAGGALAAQALVAGSAAHVEETVIYLQALAKSHRLLGHAPEGCPEWSALVAMEDLITDEHARLERFSDDGAASVKELERKRESIRRALDWFVKESLDPARLSAGG